MAGERLFEHFPPVTTSEWLEKIRSDLKGADFDRKLVWRTNEGLGIMPFYRSEDLEDLVFSGEFPFIREIRKENNSWLIRQDIEVTDYLKANGKALSILMKGVDSLGFIISNPSTVNPENFHILLKDIHPEAVELNFLCNGLAKEILENVRAVFTEKGYNLSGIRGAIEADPLGRLMLNGKLCLPTEAAFDYLASLTEAASDMLKMRTLHLKASNFCNAGADLVQELAFAISMGNEYMSRLTERGVAPGKAASKIRFSFGTGSGYFMEIAKLRAARVLWSLVLKAYIGEKDDIPGMEIHCITSRWNKTLYDPFVNMLRTQTEAMSAVLGGADSLTVEPFDAAFRPSGAFSERTARNQQLILKEEAGFDKVSDPSAGSYYIEKITDLLAESAWKLYVDMEAGGGFLEALRSGSLKKMIHCSAEKRKKDIATRKTILLGTNQYPMADERIPSDADMERIFSKADSAESLTIFRGAEEYEKIRLAVESSGKQPLVFIFPVGNQAMRRARSQFSSVFFGCAGYRVADNNGFDSVEAGVEAFISSNADIVVICSSDEEYPAFAPEIFRNLKDRAVIVIAGNPACATELKAAGIENFIHSKSDVPETLRYYNNRLGIKPL